MYAYSFNGPTNYYDPTGRCPFCIVVAIGAIAGAAVEGYKAYECGERGWALAGATDRGAAAGGAGALAGLAATIYGGVNPLLGGAAGGAAYAYTKNLLRGNVSTEEVLQDVAVGGVAGVAAEALTPAVQGGENFNPFTSPRTFGPQAQRLYDTTVTGTGIGAVPDLLERKNACP